MSVMVLPSSRVPLKSMGTKRSTFVPGAKTDVPAARYASRSKWGPLLKAGIKIYEYEPTMYHCKVMIVDDVWVTVGSANFDSRSMFLNFEVSSVIHSPGEVKAVEAWIEQLMTQTKVMDDKTGTRRDIMEGIARLITPML